MCPRLTPDFLPGGNTIKADWATTLYEKLGPSDPLTKLVIAQDWKKLEAYLNASLGHGGTFRELRTSTVPLFVSYAWDDTKHFANVNANAFPKLRNGVPRRFAMLTGGHASQHNDTDVTVRRDMIQRWLDRFAKGYKNGIDVEPFAEISVIPASPADYRDAKRPWKHRQTRAWPPKAPRKRFYLRSGQRLSPSAPGSIEKGPVLAHRVRSGYDMVAFLKDGMKLRRILSSIPFRSVHFDTAPLGADTELFGRSTVELDVVANNKSFQLQAALYDVAPSGAARFVTAGHAAKWKVVPGRHRVAIELADVAYVVEKGHRVRVALENLNVRRHPGNPHLFAAPYFENVDMTVQIDPAFAPRADLPMIVPGVSLRPRLQQISASSPIADLRVDGEGQRAGRVYALYVGASGTAPGVVLPPRIPLNVDNWTLLGIALMNTPVFDRFAGVLDAGGAATARLRLPAAVAGKLAGTRLSVPGLVIGKGGKLDATAPAEILIRP